MSGIDVEALLESTAEPGPTQQTEEATVVIVETRDPDRDRDRDRDRIRDGSRDHDRDRRRRDRSRERRSEKDADGDEEMRSPRAIAQLTEDERDKRTVFVQQLAARLRTKELIAFFEKAGPVKDAQIVKDRVSGRSKGVGYVEFKNEESVPLAIQLTGQKLLGIPIIAQFTEAEKNKAARNTEGHVSGNQNSIPFHRLYVGNIHFSITESDLQNVFEPFGELDFVQLQKDENGRSRGYGFVQFRDPNQAREALEKMNGFDLAGRPIRVGLGNDKFSSDPATNLMRLQAQGQQNSLYGQGGRGAATALGGNFDRAGGRDNDKGVGGASALDDTDVAGVNFNNYSRDALMRKLARTDEPAADTTADDKRKAPKARPEAKPLPVSVNMASRCVLLRNMFDPTEEEGDSWVKELEDDVRAECEEKYGHVVHIALDPNAQGDIYLKFDRVQGGENAIKGLNGRFFGGRQITAQPVVDAVYSSLFSRTKAI
ncbi:RNA-binding domain containing protein rsd1 [Coccidioides immitis RMSCC 3703]|uniref:RNA-binding domain containing protein rsd1 n=1 Tax=Coccidioides immitis RMSCC 3703 TaxID=454286 RepID=A0A0J8U2T1_COCIT|nr:RNA-binding domain containing protein rsd1 [Coccidioides immitis RMSCC 3703]